MIKQKTQKVTDHGLQYSVPYNGSSEVRTNYYTQDQLLEYLFDDGKTLYELFMRGVRISGNKPCCGCRPEPELPYFWITYDEVLERAKFVGSGLIELGAKPNSSQFIGIAADNRIETVLVELACNCYSMVFVPLPNVSPEIYNDILQVSKVKIMIVDTLSKAKEILKDVVYLNSHFNAFVIIEKLDEEIHEIGKKNQIKIYTFSQLELLGEIHMHDVVPPKPDDVFTITFSSGTTGTPKGMMLTHKNLVASVSSGLKLFERANIKFDSSQVYMSFYPASSAATTLLKMLLFAFGGRVGLFSGNKAEVLNDAQAIKPTIFVSPVQLCSLVYEKILNDVKQSSIKMYLLNAAINYKKHLLENGILSKNTIWDFLIFRKVRNLFGGKIKIFVTGGAPIPAHIFDFFKIALGAHTMCIYGLTETATLICVRFPFDLYPGSVGPPLSCSIVKLVDALEQNYFVENGFGEICIKGPNVFSGYYKDEELAKAAIDQDGWFHTGDIGTWLKNGSLKIIDRKKNIFILSNGERISPEKIELVFLQIPIIYQIFIYGDENHDFLVAIVVPDHEIFSVWCGKKKIFKSYKFLFNDPTVIEYALQEMQKLGFKSDLKVYEIPKKLFLLEEYFSQENGLMTATKKAKRHQIYMRFRSEIENMLA